MGERPARERIVEAALGLIGERGLGGVTITAVAEAAGVSRQTVYNHFEQVDGMVGEAITAHQADSMRSLEALLSTVDSPSGRVVHLVRHAAAMAADGHGAPGLQHGLSPEIQEVLDGHAAQVRSLIARILQDGVDRGEFRTDLDPGADALLVQRLLDGIGDLAADDPAGVAGIVERSTRTVLAAIRAG